MPRLLLATWIALSACAGEPRDPAAVVVALEAPPETLDRRMALSAAAMRVCQLVTPGLTRIDGRGAAVPDLAASFTAEDARTFTFVLREGLVFSDGAKLTADDVAATYRSVLDPATGSPHRGGYSYLERVDVIDERTIRFVLQKPFGAFPVDGTLGILPARLTAPEHRETVRRAPIGAGPFVVDRWEGDERVLLEPNGRYHGGAPALPVEIRTVRDETTRVLELRKGRVDLLQNAVTPALLPALRGEDDLAVEIGPGTGVSYLMFQLRDPALRKREVREAIAAALDRDALARFKFKGAARPADSLLPPEHWAYAKGSPRPRDLARARALLDAAGYPDPGDGRPRLALTYKTSTDRFRRALAQVMAAQLAEAGIAVEVQPLEWGTLMGDLKRGNFQLASLKWAAVVDPDIFRLAYHSENIPTEATGFSGFNRMRYASAALDPLLDRGRALVAQDERAAVYREVQAILDRDLPALPLFHEDSVLVRARSLGGVTVNPQGSLEALAGAVRVSP